jgi:hypothetical protein
VHGVRESVQAEVAAGTPEQLRAAVGSDAPYVLVAASPRDMPSEPAEVAVPWPVTLTRRAPQTLASLTCAHVRGIKVARHF